MDMDIGSARIIHIPANFASKKMERTTEDFAGFIGDVLYMLYRGLQRGSPPINFWWTRGMSSSKRQLAVFYLWHPQSLMDWGSLKYMLKISLSPIKPLLLIGAQKILSKPKTPQVMVFRRRLSVFFCETQGFGLSVT